MYLTKQDFSQKGILKNVEPNNFYSVGYDLSIESIIDVNNPSDKALNTFDLYPGATVFVSTIEDIELPNDIVGIVVQKNSLIRKGLQIAAPIYQPGHKTKIFIRVTNISGDMFQLKSGQQIAAIMFEKTSSKAEPYNGRYAGEFDYRNVPEYPTDTLPQLHQLDKKIKDISDLEEAIINKVLTIMTVIVGLFTLININLQVINQNVWNMIVYNLITIGTLSFLVGLMGIILQRNNKKTCILIFVLAFLLIGASCIVTAIKLV